MNEDVLKQEMDSVLSGSPAVTPEAKEIEVPEPTAMPATASTFRDAGGNVTRTTVPNIEPETPDYARYSGGTHTPGTRLIDTSYRAEDGSEGSPFFYKTKYAPVVPYDTVYSGRPVRTSTQAKNKLDWEMLTSIDGVPDVNYFGYNYIEPPTENLIQSGFRQLGNWVVGLPAQIAKGIAKGAVDTGTSAALSELDKFGAMGKTASGMIPVVSRVLGKEVQPEDVPSPFFIKNSQTRKDVLDANEMFIKAVDDVVDPIRNAMYWTYTDVNETDMSRRAKYTGMITTGAASVGAALALPVLAAGLAASEGLGAYSDVRSSTLDMGVSNERSMMLAGLAGAGVGALGILPEVGQLATRAAILQSSKTLIRKATNEAMKRSLLNKTREGVLRASRTGAAVGALGEMISEPAQTDWTLLLGSDFDWSKLEGRWDERAVEAGAAFLGGVVGGYIETRGSMKRYDKIHDDVKQFRASIAKSIDKYRPILEKAVQDGVMTKDQMEGLINLSADPETLNSAVDYVTDCIAGQFDKIPQEQIADFEKRLKDLDPKLVLDEEYKKLDSKVLDAIKNAETTKEAKLRNEDVALLVSLFRGIANWRLYLQGQRPSELTVPDLSFVINQVAGKTTYGGASKSKVDIALNIMDPAMPASAKGDPFAALYSKNSAFVDRGVSARHSTMLHEMAHLVDMLVGVKGAGEFFAEYYDAIAKAFGTKRANQVKNSRPLTSKENSDSKRNYTSPRNKGEHFARAMGALAENAARAAGIEGNAAAFVEYANLMLNGMNKATILAEGVRNYLDEVETVIRENEALVKEIAEVFGTDRLNNALKEYMSDDVTELSETTIPTETLSDLVDALNSFGSKEGLPLLKKMFNGIDANMFVEKTQKMFRDALAEGRKNVAKGEKRKKNSNAGGKTGSEPFFSEADSGVEYETDGGDTTFGLPTVEELEEAKAEAADAEQVSNSSPITQYLTNKVDGHTIEEDVDAVLSAIKDAKQTKIGRVIKALYKRSWIGTLADKLNILGGKALKDRFDLVGKGAEYETQLRDLQFSLVKKMSAALFPGVSEGMARVKMHALFSKWNQSVGKIKRRAIPGSDIGVYEQDFTGWQVIDTYLNKMQGKKIRERNKAGYATGELEKLFNANFTPEMKSVGDAMLGFMNDVKPLISAARGKTVGNNEKFYMPIVDAFYSTMTNQKINSLKARNWKSNAPLVSGNALELMDAYVRRLASSLSGRYRQMQRLSDVFLNRPDESMYKFGTPEQKKQMRDIAIKSMELRNRVIDIIGEDGMQNLRHDIEFDLINNDVTPYKTSGVLNKAMNSVVRGMLSFKPNQYFKGLANTASWWGSTDSVAQYLKDTVYGLTHFKSEMLPTMLKIKAIRNRMRGQGYSDVLNAELGGGDTILPEIQKAIGYKDSHNITGVINAVASAGNRIGLAPLVGGDASANIIGGYGYVRYLQRQGLSQEQIDIAVQKFIDQTQSSSNQAMKNALQKDWQRKGLLGNFISFTTEGVAKSKAYTDALLAYSRGEITATEAGKQIAPVVMSQLIFAMISAGMFDLLFGDDEEKSEAEKVFVNELLSAGTGITPLSGTFITPIIQYASGTSDYLSFSPSLLSATTKALREMKQGDVDKMVQNALVFTGLSSGAREIANLYEGGQQYFSDDEEESEIGARRLTGRTRASAEKRVRPTKKKVDNKQ